MNFASQLFMVGFEWSALCISVLVLLWALFKSPWPTVLADSSLQHRFLGCVVGLVLLWQMSVDLHIGVIIHFIGLTTMTLFFGVPLAILAGSVALFSTWVNQWDQWNVVGINFLFNVLVPVLATYWVHLVIESRRPTNPFVFILGTGFFGCVFSTTLTTLLAVLSLKLFSDMSFKLSLGDYLGYLPIFVFPEAVVNGMFISATTILHPHVVVTFNEARYFKQTEQDMVLDEFVEPSLDLEQTEAPDEPDDQRYRPPKEWYDKDKDS